MAWHLWMALGVMFMIAELFVPGFIALSVGSAMVLTGALSAALALEPTHQLLTVSALIPLCFVLFYALWGRKRTAPRPAVYGQSQEEFIGITGTMTQPCTAKSEGQAHLDAPIMGERDWQVRCTEPLEAGASIRVLAVQGNTLHAARA